MKSWIVGNWKLNPASVNAVQALVDDLVEGVDAQGTALQNCHIMVAPSLLHLSQVEDILRTKSAAIKLACQDVSALSAETGAYTGDVSAQQLQDLGVQWAIIGHSERRQYFNEDNDTLLNKMKHCAAQGLGVIFCIGESEADFEAGKTTQVLAEQLTIIANFLQQSEAVDADYIANKLIIAYEPVWAIGTGKVPSVEEVTEVHKFIRERLQSFEATLGKTPVLYGGSVKPENAQDFAASEQINGVLVGGAALKAGSFLDIAKAFSK
ncbi:triose-phosphate isomerase [Psychrobacter sp. UBA3962]|uniref:triose-phosphate isomerase n=1 Tax=Psychrobacter sp. UBA3962 TaxID=1947352 RepID=UPI0025D35A1D|nr:triose-phosphate isomerase [Psychrobacter sp. UBA3962]